MEGVGLTTTEKSRVRGTTWARTDELDEDRVKGVKIGNKTARFLCLTYKNLFS